MHTQDSSPRRILAFPGSLRRDSYNLRLLHAAQQLAPAGLSIEIAETYAEVPLFNEDIEHTPAGGPPAVQRLREQLNNAHGLLIATAEYNQSIPGVLKNLIDWLSRDDNLKGKPTAIIGATIGLWGTRLAQNVLRQVLFATQCQIMPTPGVFMAKASNCFNEEGELIDERSQKSLEKVLHAFETWVRKHDVFENA